MFKIFKGKVVNVIYLQIATYWSIRLSADNVIIYRVIHSNDDILMLQEDLIKSSAWADIWLSFNLKKCKHLIISNKMFPLNTTYKINKSAITKFTHTKYHNQSELIGEGIQITYSNYQSQLHPGSSTKESQTVFTVCQIMIIGILLLFQNISNVWETFEQRRAKATIILFYKIADNIVSVQIPNLLQRPAMWTRGHQ